jgi:Tol biopolymer transport system component
MMHKLKVIIAIGLILGLAACSTPPPPDAARAGLTGRLVLIEYNPNGDKLIEQDLKSGDTKVLFQAPKNSLLTEARVSPDGTQILLVYAPPPPGNQVQFGYSDLYLLPLDGTSQPQPFMMRGDQEESFYFSAWAPDGSAIYFTHSYRTNPNSDVPKYQNDIESVTLSMEKKTVIQNALWPAISPDGTKLAYLVTNPDTLGDDLYLANLDGSNPAPVLQGTNPPVDVHLFSKDGDNLIFSMVNAQNASADSTWLDKLFGIQVASAHSVPSDWYLAPLSGGTPQRLTKLKDLNLNGQLSPDGSQMAFVAASGLYVINVDGTNLVKLSNGAYDGTVDWIP